MAVQKPKFRKTEYVIEGSTVRLSYLDEKERILEDGAENVRNRNQRSRDYYSYRDNRGRRVHVKPVSENSRRSRMSFHDNAERVERDDYFEHISEEEFAKREEEERKIEKSRLRRSISINFPTLIVLTLVLVVAGYVSMSYLSTKAEIISLKDEIAAMDSKIENLRDENNVQRAQIEDNIDMQKVYRVATKELGMVHPQKQQVLKYDSRKNDTVRQYGDIPGTEQSTFDKLLNQ